MEKGFNLIARILLSALFIFLSIIFFYQGYDPLRNIKFSSKLNYAETNNSIDIKNQDIQIDSQFKIQKFKSFLNKEKDKNNNFTKEEIIIVKKNDNFSKLIDPYLSDNKIKHKIIKLINEKFDLKKLKIGQKIYLYFSHNAIKNEITKIVIPINFNTEIILKKNIDASYSIHELSQPVEKELIAHKFKITKSLFEDSINEKVPLAIISKIIKMYSFDVDFQRDIQKGNEFEILYEVFFNEKRKNISFGDIIYTNLTLQKNNLEYFLFKTTEGFLDYFNREGKNFKKALMKTPLDGARISSSFGMRKHPISGYNKMHQGTDFAAPKGTEVFAAGNGVIEYTGKKGSYGKYILIRHNSSYKTAYAHLNSYKKGISKGVRVTQGQVIGYVGSTGSSTGSHLHYEVIFENQKINPMKMKLPSGKVLKQEELKQFKKISKTIYANYLFHLFE